MKKIVIAAGTGFLGNVLIDHFKNMAETIIVLTRGKAYKNNNIHYVTWDAKNLNGWELELEDADALINLAGKSVDCRYNNRNKDEIMAPRIDSTTVLGRAIAQCTKPPKHWLNSSTATIYRHSEDKQMDEVTGEIGHDFSMTVAKLWERAFFEANIPSTKKTALRTSIVLGNKGGAFPALKRLALLRFGGRQGNGNQYISWIHQADFARITEYVITNGMEGVVNVVSPTPVHNKQFMSLLRHALHIPFGVSIPKSLLKFGAAVIGTETELVLKSRNVIPKRLTDSGFVFEYGELGKALKNLVTT